MAINLPIKRQRIFKGFTLIEIVVASALLMTVSVVSVANFTRYSESQKIKNVAMDLSLILQKARSRAQAQIKPSDISICEGYPLKGYEVRICSSMVETCIDGDSYGLYVHCGTDFQLIEMKYLPQKVRFGVGSDRSFYFELMKGTVNEGLIVLDSDNIQKTIEINNLGSINIL